MPFDKPCSHQVMLLNKCCLELHEELPDGQLFPDKPDLKANPKVMEWSERIGLEDFSIFFGRGAGLHMTASSKRMLSLLMYSQAMFADISANSLFSKVTNWLGNGMVGITYLTNPDYMGDRIYANARQSQVYFAKSFFGMSEMNIVHR